MDGNQSSVDRRMPQTSVSGVRVAKEGAVSDRQILFSALAREAGALILRMRCEGFDVEQKFDASPVTLADREAEELILNGLRKGMLEGRLADMPIVAEEEASAGTLPDVGNAPFLLVDPLDGTREFVSGRGDFTVNIAVIESGVPVCGVVYQPATDILYGGEGHRAWRERSGRRETIACATFTAGQPLGIVASKSHRTQETDEWISAAEKALGVEVGGSRLVAVGSSLKFCRIAEGRAHLYPRMGRTMEWDTAAGDAVLRAAGGMVHEVDGKPFRYGRHAGGGLDGLDAPFANPHFVAVCRFQQQSDGSSKISALFNGK